MFNKQEQWFVTTDLSDGCRTCFNHGD